VAFSVPLKYTKALRNNNLPGWKFMDRKEGVSRQYRTCVCVCVLL